MPLSATDPAVAGATVTVLTLVIKGVFDELRERRRERGAQARAGFIVKKIDENTSENRAQIEVSNHVNAKLETTTATAERANSIAADGLAQVQRDMTGLRSSVERIEDAVRTNTTHISLLLAKAATRAD